MEDWMIVGGMLGIPAFLTFLDSIAKARNLIYPERKRVKTIFAWSAAYLLWLFIVCSFEYYYFYLHLILIFSGIFLAMVYPFAKLMAHYLIYKPAKFGFIFIRANSAARIGFQACISNLSVQKLAAFERFSEMYPGRFAGILQLWAQTIANPVVGRNKFSQLSEDKNFILPKQILEAYCLGCYTASGIYYGKCTRCGKTGPFELAVTSLVATYAPGKPYYTPDHETGTLYVNLAEERIWVSAQVRFTAVELDLAQVEHPDWFISRLLSSFEHLQDPTAGVAWRLTGTELLGENTQRLLTPVVGKR